MFPNIRDVGSLLRAVQGSLATESVFGYVGFLHRYRTAYTTYQFEF